MRKSLFSAFSSFAEVSLTPTVFLQLVMGDDRCADFRPIVKPLGIVNCEVDATVTHRRTKVVMPVRAVNGVATVKVHYVRDAG